MYTNLLALHLRSPVSLDSRGRPWCARPYAYNLSTILSTMSVHCSTVMYSLFKMALVMAMTWTTLAEFTHTSPFKPTVNSNLKYLPSASTTAHEGDNSLYTVCVCVLCVCVCVCVCTLIPTLSWEAAPNLCFVTHFLQSPMEHRRMFPSTGS